MAYLLAIGFLIGMRHALEADHVAAVATLATRARSTAECVRQGALWGVGHTATLFLFGTLVLLVDQAIPARLAAGLELAVGLMLIGLGIDVIRRVVRDGVQVQTQVREHDEEIGHAHDHGRQRRGGMRALLVGLMHGMAGSAALILLTLDRTTSIGMGMVYIGMFGLGSTLGMALLSLTIAIPMRVSADSLSRFQGRLHWAVGLLSMVVGAIAIYDAGVAGVWVR